MSIRLEWLIQNYKGTPHHQAALNMLEDMMPPELLKNTADWVVCFNTEDTPACLREIDFDQNSIIEKDTKDKS